jgi:hypothetical protein
MEYIEPNRAWSLLFAGADRQFQGNDGYEDLPDAFYSYDSTVSNARHIQAGDLVVVRSGAAALGVAVVERVEIDGTATKTRRRCPNPSCGKTSFKERVKMSPRFKCSPCQAEFDTPAEEVISVTNYRAHYRRSWTPLEESLDRQVLGQLSLSRSEQNSIRELDAQGTLSALHAKGVRVFDPGQIAPVIGAGSAAAATSSAEPAPIPGGRSRALVNARRGQDVFRKALIRKFGFICAVTGPAPGEVLEAAHLRAFAETEKHDVEEGLLLRTDIHRLFDRGLVAIDPVQRIVRVAPRLMVHRAYAALNGIPLAIAEPLVPTTGALSPSR